MLCTSLPCKQILAFPFIDSCLVIDIWDLFIFYIIIIILFIYFIIIIIIIFFFFFWGGHTDFFIVLLESGIYTRIPASPENLAGGGGGGGGALFDKHKKVLPACQKLYILLSQYWGRGTWAPTSYIGQIFQQGKKALSEFWPKFYPYCLKCARKSPKLCPNQIHW